jgi:hypothetical protein
MSALSWTPKLNEAALTRRGGRAKPRVHTPLVATLGLALWVAVLALFASGSGQVVQQPQSPSRNDATPRFTHYDVFVDHGDPGLAAYQVEVRFSANVTLVGIEGGEHPGFAEPPYYDPAALHNARESRIILAAFTTGADVPAIKTRVARVHVRIVGDAPRAEARVITAANPSGDHIDATVTLSAGDR